MSTDTLPANIERQLSDLELRHKRHQQMLDDHHERKHIARENHRARRYTHKPIPITLR